MFVRPFVSTNSLLWRSSSTNYCTATAIATATATATAATAATAAAFVTAAPPPADAAIATIPTITAVTTATVVVVAVSAAGLCQCCFQPIHTSWYNVGFFLTVSLRCFVNLLSHLVHFTFLHAASPACYIL